MTPTTALDRDRSLVRSASAIRDRALVLSDEFGISLQEAIETLGGHDGDDDSVVVMTDTEEAIERFVARETAEHPEDEMSCTFVKKCGSVRDMHFYRDTSKIKATATEMDRLLQGLMTVIDADLDQFRVVNLRTVQELVTPNGHWRFVRSTKRRTPAGEAPAQLGLGGQNVTPQMTARGQFTYAYVGGQV